MTKVIKIVGTIGLAILLLAGVHSATGQVQAENPKVETELTDFVPSWVKEGGKSDMLKRMVDPELREQIEKEINENVAERVEDVSEIDFPELGDTLQDWMNDFDQETNFDYDISPGQALWSFVNLDYDDGNTLYVDEFTVNDLDKEETAFSYNFEGEDGDSWDPDAFGDDLHSYPKNPDAINYSIEDNTGKVEVDTRRDGTSSSYGKLTPNMEDLNNSEVMMRFRVDELGSTQWLRLWIQSDKFASGSSFAANGYGIALHLGKDELVLQQRTNSNTTKLDDVTANMTTDWHWLKLRASDGKVSVSLWNDNEEEPEDWDIEYDLDQISKKAMLSFSNLDQENANAFYIDDLTVESPSAEEPIYQHDFAGDDGEEWDVEAFDQLHAYPDSPDGVAYSLEDNTGKIKLGEREDELSVPYGKVIPQMENVKDSDLLVRFRADELDNDQRMRAFIRADKFHDGNSSPVNGYGIEWDLKTDQLSMFKMENKVTYHFDSIDANMTTEWHWLRLRIEDDEVAVRVWEDGEQEPEKWDMMHETKEKISAGEAIMRLLMLRGDLETVYTPIDSEEPEVDKEALKEKISEINAADLNESEYTEESWSNFTDAFERAQEVVDDEVTQEEVDEVLSELIEAFEGLEEKEITEKDALQKKVDEIKAEELDESKYTEDSWEAFQTALTISEELLALDDTNINESIIEKALNNLELAHEELTEN